MTGFGGNQYGMQSRQAADGKAGGPSMRPSAGDRRVVLLAGIGLAVAAVVVAILAAF